MTTEGTGSAEEKVLSYQEIAKYHDFVDRTKRNSVRLTKQQYSLFTRLNERNIEPARGIKLVLDMLGYTWTLVVTALTAKYLFLLAYFHNHDLKSFNDIQATEEGDSVVVTFNASALAQKFEDERR